MALQKRYGHQIQFIIADIDSTGSFLAGKFRVAYIPYYIFIDSSGKRVVNDLAGYLPEEKLAEMLERLLEN